MTLAGPRSRLARNLAAEAEAYGFSLATWGSGAVVVHDVGVPGVVGASAFVGGAVSGFSLLAMVAFGSLLGGSTPTSGRSRSSRRSTCSRRPARCCRSMR